MKDEIVITSHPTDEGKRIQVGKFEFQKATTAVEGSLGPTIGGLGSGISYYIHGRYIGYHHLSDDICDLPLERITETKDFKDFYKELIVRH